MTRFYVFLNFRNKSYDLPDAAQRFVRWQDESYWTAHGRVFDIGIATAEALQRLRRGVAPQRAGGTDEYSNGNGSLMRILPLVFAIQGWPITERFQAVRDVSGITHGHIRSTMACFIYLEVACHLLLGLDKQAAYNAMHIEDLAARLVART